MASLYSDTNLPEVTDDRKDELYLYSIKKLAETNVESNRQSVTGLYNIRAFHYLGDQELRNNPHIKFAIITIDIANFKSINEFIGREGGDALLCHIAKVLENHCVEHSVLSHFRADIFTLLQPYNEKDDLINLVNTIADEIDSFQMNFKCLPAFGICEVYDSTIPVSTYRDYAAMALKTIKGKFYAKYAFYDEKMRQEMLREKQIENDVVDALKDNQIKAFIQPKIDMRTGEIIGGEALVRWLHPEHGIIPPGEFIPTLEKNGLIIDLDICVWNQIFEMQSNRIRSGKPVVPVSINISRIHAYDSTFRDYLVNLSEKYGVTPSLVPLELTESCFIDKADEMYENMQYLKSKGFMISMDDFGTGYSTMTMLKDHPVDEIKIDKGFIDDIDNPSERIMVNSMITMLTALGKKIIVEGVEDKKQQDFLIESGCTSAQGFLYHKPMPMPEFEKMLDETNQ